jgi:acylphosphatase
VRTVNIVVTGKVQGVFFRVFARNEAVKLNLQGIVKNLPDGTVYIEAIGHIIDVDKFISWCHKGSPGARVENVIVHEFQMKHFESFTITY